MTSTALTFFSGAGGMCNGLDQAGFEIIGGNEWDDQIADIWDANHDVKCDRRSILDIPTASLPYADLYHFSPPCQLHSQSNPNRTTGTDCEDTAIALVKSSTNPGYSQPITLSNGFGLWAMNGVVLKSIRRGV